MKYVVILFLLLSTKAIAQKKDTVPDLTGTWKMVSMGRDSIFIEFENPAGSIFNVIDRMKKRTPTGRISKEDSLDAVNGVTSLIKSSPILFLNLNKDMSYLVYSNENAKKTMQDSGTYNMDRVNQQFIMLSVIPDQKGIAFNMISVTPVEMILEKRSDEPELRFTCIYKKIQ